MAGKLAVAGQDKTLTLPPPTRQAIRALGDAVIAQAAGHRCLSEGDPLAAQRYFKATTAALTVARAWDDRAARKGSGS